MTVTPLLTPKTAVNETVSRHPLNFYESPSWFTTELLRHVPLSGVIGEPCVGHRAIASLLNVWPYTDRIWTNDIDPNKSADYHLDATLTESWEKFPDCDWICTNPPYAEFAAPIIKNAYRKARFGVAAFLLTSFLEPCDDRADFLQQHPPSLVLTLPRFCFRKDKRGTRWATDNITISCFVWDKRATTQRIIVRPKSQIIGFYKNPEQAISQERAEEIVRADVQGQAALRLRNRRIMKQMTLFDEPTAVLPITYYPDFLNKEEASELYQHCQQLQWQQNQIRMVGKTILVPRLECIYGDKGCDYLKTIRNSQFAIRNY